MRNYPQIKRVDVTDDYFGVQVADPYRYLENLKGEDTRAVIQAENAYTKAWFDARKDFSASELEKELRARPKGERMSIEEACGVRCASHVVEGGLSEVVLLDENWKIKETLLNDEMLDHRMHVFSASPCPTQAGIFDVRTVKHGAPRCCSVVYDYNNKKVLAELDDLFAASWSEDGESIVYSDAKPDRELGRNVNRVHRYFWRENRLETLYEYPENAVFIDVEPAPGEGLLLEVKIDYGNSLMLYRDKDGAVIRLNDGVGEYAYMGMRDGLCYFKTDANAPMSQIITIKVEELTYPNALLECAKVAIPQSDVRIAAAGLVADGILVVQEEHACSALVLYSETGEKRCDIALPDSYGAVVANGAMKATDEGHVFFIFLSFTKTPMTLMYNEADHTLTPVFQSEASDTDDIAVDPCFFEARDGERLLVYIVRQKDLKPSGNTPALMYGYGGYANTLKPTPENSPTAHNIVEWVRKGRIYAHCILRGGSEYGVSWHEAGMKMNKKNAFHDFIDAAEYLIAQGWTCPEKIVATGQSNGGLLMTAITTIRPDLFGTVIASVPHTDMLRFRNDDRGMMYVTEYGDPLSSKEMFEYMHSYSPYHNIHEGVKYPYIYVQTGEKDNNVPCYHGEKFAVRLQAAADEAHPVLLEVLAHGSHNRGVGDEYYMNIAQIQTFVEIGLARGDE